MKRDIKEWLRKIEASGSAPSEDIIAFNFGLFETSERYIAYLMGASIYSEQDDSWANEDEYSPRFKYLELPAELHNHSPLYTQQFMIDLLKQMKQEGEFEDTFIDGAVAITTGFDHEQLVRIC